MKQLRSIRQWYKRLFRRHRLVLQNEIDNIEEWHIHTSAARIFAGLVAFVLLLFMLILALVAYTPVLEFLPGYEANRSREMLLRNIMRLDSIERHMNELRIYSENVSLIMEGKTPVIPSDTRHNDSIRIDKSLVMPSHEDSILRAEIEGSGPYALGKSPSRRTVREAMEMVAPLEGILTEKFDVRQSRYGVRIAAASGSQVVAVDNGAVVFNLWTPDEGYMVGIQHAGNLFSIYKNLSQTLVTTGQRIKRGEVIGYSGDTQQAGNDAKLFGFELWSDGSPVDPEGYLLF